MVAAQPALARALLDAPPDGVQRARRPRCATRTRPGCRSPSSAAGRPSTARWRSPRCSTTRCGGALAAGGGRAPVARRGRAPAARRRLHRRLARRRHARDDARARGRRRRRRGTALITARPDGSAAGPAELVLITPVHDDSWCHTVGYTSSIADRRRAGARARRSKASTARAAEALLPRRSPRRRDAAPLARLGADPVRGRGHRLHHRARARAQDRRGRARPDRRAAPRDAAARPPRRRGRRHRPPCSSTPTRAPPGSTRRAELAADRACARSACRSLETPGRRGLSAPLARLLGGAAALQGLTLALVHARA